MDTATHYPRVAPRNPLATLAHMVTSSPEGAAYNRAVIEALRRHNDSTRRFTHDELATITGLSKSTIARMFAPNSARQIEVTVRVLADISRALRVDPRKILDEAESSL